MSTTDPCTHKTPDQLPDLTVTIPGEYRADVARLLTKERPSLAGTRPAPPAALRVAADLLDRDALGVPTTLSVSRAEVTFAEPALPDPTRPNRAGTREITDLTGDKIGTWPLVLADEPHVGVIVGGHRQVHLSLDQAHQLAADLLAAASESEAADAS